MAVTTPDSYLEKHPQWREQLARLRGVLNEFPLEEGIKWGAPAYSLDGQLLIGLVAFKHHLALWFHQGALLSDPDDVLINAQEGRTRAMRQWRFGPDDPIRVTRVRPYIREAIRLQRAGQRIAPVKKQQAKLPAELRQALSKNRELQQAFADLTPGKQREYADHIASAKREQTRLNRLEKTKPMILAGIGLNDRYRSS